MMSILRILGFGRRQQTPLIRQISVDEANALASKAEITLIDVRQPDEWTDTGIPKGSSGVPLQAPDFEAQILALLAGDKSASVAFTCKSGGRSAQAADKALASGFTTVSNVEGGFLAWKEANLPIESYSA